ncbi:hypothetical protein [Nitrososphaera sp. AFS]|uniref:hypothetical protein n=1 Tax=Nitrososphaera sp. AFS TaxID=2301191 RepID=UPI00139240D5|nr:hypothetical protein [Nitrososphaera sp. AFS]NAL78842.1 hypothetical protein [Nitrososphaera sp. AFS]
MISMTYPVKVLTIALLLTSSLLLFILSSNDYSAFTLIKAKKSSSSSLSSSSSHITSTTLSKRIKTTRSSTSIPSATGRTKPHSLGHIHRFSSDFQTISQNLIAAATNDNAITDPSQCNTHLNDFILPAKEARFIILNPCITVSGTIIYTDYFNPDGDANFNIVLDSQYKNMLGPGQYTTAFFAKFHSGTALHIEVPCQGPVTSTKSFNVGACNGYDGPNFKPLLPKSACNGYWQISNRAARVTRRNYRNTSGFVNKDSLIIT